MADCGHKNSKETNYTENLRFKYTLDNLKQADLY